MRTVITVFMIGFLSGCDGAPSDFDITISGWPLNIERNDQAKAHECSYTIVATAEGPRASYASWIGAAVEIRNTATSRREEALVALDFWGSDRIRVGDTLVANRVAWSVADSFTVFHQFRARLPDSSLVSIPVFVQCSHSALIARYQSIFRDSSPAANRRGGNPFDDFEQYRQRYGDARDSVFWDSLPGPDPVAEYLRQYGDARDSLRPSRPPDSTSSRRSGPRVGTTASGVSYEVLKEGSGRQPGATDQVTVHYRITLLDGTNVRATTTSINISEAVSWLGEALQLMKVGSSYRFVLPAAMAFGTRGLPGVVPPNATIVYEVELLFVP